MPATPRRLRPQPRVIIYARVSRDQRSGRSVAQQLAIGRRVAAEHGWEIVGEYSDNDRSASRYAKSNREDWPKVEEAIRAGEADVLWVWEISRGTRDLVVWAQLAVVCREKSMLVALDEDVWDTTKPSHMRHLNQLMVDAAYESDKTQERIARDVEAVASEGRPHGVPGYGFTREYDPRTGQLLRQVVNPEQAKVVRQIVDWYLAGISIRGIARKLNEQKVPTSLGYLPGDLMYSTRTGEPIRDKRGRHIRSAGWTYSTVEGILSRPALMGKRMYNGQIVEAGGWEAIISEAEWWAIRRRLQQGRGRVRDGAAVHLLSGIAVCDVCGAWIRSCGGPRIRERRVYRCAGLYPGAEIGHVARVETTIDAHVEAFVVAEFSRPDVLEVFRAQESGEAEQARARADAERLRAELEELYEEVRAGKVSRLMAQADEDRISRELAEAEELARPRGVDPMAVALAGPAAHVLRVWRGWEVDQKRSALRALTEEIRVLRVGNGRRKVLPEESLWIRWKGQE